MQQNCKITPLQFYTDTLQSFEAAHLLVSQHPKNTAIVLQHLHSCCLKVEHLLKMETDSLIQTVLYQLYTEMEKEINKYTTISNQPHKNGQTGAINETSREKKENYDLLNSLKVTPKVKSLNDVIGLQSVKKYLKTMVIMPMKQPQLFDTLAPKNCILLFGPPGTGKTRIVHALAAEANASLLCVTPSNILSEYVGRSEKTIKSIFEEAKKSKDYSIIFMDEVDAFFSHRTGSEKDHNRRTKTEFLCQLTDIEDCKDVFIICATNVPWDLDSAFVRRFHQQLYIPLPNRDERYQLFEYYTQNTALINTRHNWDFLLDSTDGYSASDIANIIRTALSNPIMELEGTYHWKLTYGQFYEPSTSDDFCIYGDVSSLPTNTVRSRQPNLQDLIQATTITKRTVPLHEANKYTQFLTK